MGSKISILIIVIALITSASFLYDSLNHDGSLQKATPIEYLTYSEQSELKIYDLAFENYLINNEVYIGEIADVNFETNILAREYESIIKSGVANIGINYAGEYSIVTWGCGSDCQASSIVNVKTGEIVSYGIISAYGLSYSKDSRLLIINPHENLSNIEDSNKKDIETDYYLIDEYGDLELVLKSIYGKGELDVCIQVATNAINYLTNEVQEFQTPCKIPFGWKIVGG